MSKSIQTNFFILPYELKSIDAFFKANRCLLIKKDVPKEPALLDIDISSSKEKVLQVYITKEQFKNNIHFKYLQSKDYYYVDVLSSHAIEFSLGGFYPFNDKELNRSRLYVTTEFYEDRQLVKKNADFVNWARRVVRDFKKKFLIKSPISLNNYLSEECLKWISANDAKLEAGGQKLILPGANLK
ncbi:MAG: hypothetical protein KF746_23060 [Chitinophagaceae bacterium]|nr:hypothetical protein [Chitinophagaceae bacterium]